MMKRRTFAWVALSLALMVFLAFQPGYAGAPPKGKKSAAPMPTSLVGLSFGPDMLRGYEEVGGGVMSDLNALIPAGSGWTLENANAINDAGQIVGSGLRGGKLRAFLLTPNP